ncbi:MAG: nitroreductase family protein [Spirochaetes bacterium]|nr:nitroreductase family protein [Spirochaetota bacterium]
MDKKIQKKLLDNLDKLHFYNSVNEKSRPPVSPITHETRELARRSIGDFHMAVEKAQEKAKTSGKPVEIDGSRLGGIKSGDTWVIDENGIKERYFEKNEGLLEGLQQRRTERVADPDKDIPMEQLLDVLALAQWAPNATNEQPTKIMVYHKSHPSMARIGEAMHQALYENMIPEINIKNYVINRKRESPNFLPEYSLQDVIEMDDEKFNSFEFEKYPAPLHELPQTTDKLIERGKIFCENGKYYKKKPDGGKGGEYTLKDLLFNDKVFTSGMGKFFLKFKNTHPYLIVVFRKWHYTSLMTETLYKYGIKLPDVGEEYIDAGCYTDHLALAARGYGFSNVIKTGPMDLAKDELTEIFIDDLENRISNYQFILDTESGLTEEKTKQITSELKKDALLYQGLKYGLEAMRCQKEGRPMREQLQTALKRGEVFIPATFFQLGYPLKDPEERIRDPRQGKNSLESMISFMGEI